MSELMLHGPQKIIKSEDMIPPSLQAGTAQDWVVRTARVLHCKTQTQASPAFKNKDPRSPPDVDRTV